VTSSAGSPAPALPLLRRGVLLRVVDVGGGPPPDSTRDALTAAERAYADRGTPPVAVRRVRLRAALRAAVGEVLGLAPADVPLSPPPGRPRLTGPAAASGVDVGCSASAGLGVVAVAAGARVGVDVERVRTVLLADAVEEGWLSDAERAAVAALPAEERPAVLTRCWTQKEAVLKGLGTGLRTAPATVVTPSAGRGPGRVGDWDVRSLHLPEGWVGSVALRPHPPAGDPADLTGTP
jgi:4'-phosphopantetheinyl transferase